MDLFSITSVLVVLAAVFGYIVHRELFLTITYGVVIFSITVQGLFIGPLAQRLLPSDPSSSNH